LLVISISSCHAVDLPLPPVLKAFHYGNDIEITKIVGKTKELKKGRTYTVHGTYKYSALNTEGIELPEINYKIVARAKKVVPHGTDESKALGEVELDQPNGSFSLTFRYRRNGHLLLLNLESNSHIRNGSILIDGEFLEEWRRSNYPDWKRELNYLVN